MSKLDIIANKKLNEKANEANASEADILKAALANNQEQYKDLSEQLIVEMRDTMSEFDRRLRAIEDAVKMSNNEKDINIASALKNASETIIGQSYGKIKEFDTAINKSIKHLREAQLDAKNSDIKLLVVIFAVFVSAFALGGYISNYAWGKWYNIPDKVDAINNGIYQLLHPIKK